LCGGRSEVAGSLLDRVLRKRDYDGLFDFFAGEGVAFLGAGGDTAGMISVLLTVDPLKQDIEQEVTAKDAKRQEDSE
jgi:hypothetical protein